MVKPGFGGFLDVRKVSMFIVREEYCSRAGGRRREARMLEEQDGKMRKCKSWKEELCSDPGGGGNKNSIKIVLGYFLAMLMFGMRDLPSPTKD